MNTRFTLIFFSGLLAGLVHAQVPRRTFIELFVNKECGPCGPVYPNEARELSNRAGSISAVTYAMNWPGSDNAYTAYPAGMQHRKNFYSVTSIPFSFTNGNLGFSPGTATATSPISLENHLFEIHKENASSDSLVMQTRIVASQPLAGGYWLYMGLTERTVYPEFGLSFIKTYLHVLRHFFGGDSLRTPLPAMAAGDTLVFEYRVKKSAVPFITFSEVAGLSFVQKAAGAGWNTSPVIQSSVIQPFEAARSPARTKVVHPNSTTTGTFSWSVNSYYPDTLFLKLQTVSAPTAWTAKLKTSLDSGTVLAIPIASQTNDSIRVALRVAAGVEENTIARYKISARYGSQSAWIDSLIRFQFISRHGLTLITQQPDLHTTDIENTGNMNSAGIGFHPITYADFTGMDMTEVDTTILPGVFYLMGSGSSFSMKEPFARVMQAYLQKGGRAFLCQNGDFHQNSFTKAFMDTVIGIKRGSYFVSSQDLFKLTPASPAGPWFSNLGLLQIPKSGSYVYYIYSNSGYASPVLNIENQADRSGVFKTEGNGFRAIYSHLNLQTMTPDTARYRFMKEVYRYLFQLPVTGNENLVTAIDGIHIFPVPASDYIRITWPEEAKSGDCKVFDAVGKVVWQQEGKTKPTEIHVKYWPKGVYVLSLAGSPERKRFVVQ